MKLFNKTIDRQLFKQYSLGSDLSKQEVVAKIFNPTGNGTWFILNSDPQDPDYLWAIVDLGYGAEVGSVSRSELENYRGRFGLGFERDLGFDPINAEELYQGLRNGEYYADGGEMKGKDTWQNIFEEFGFKKGRSKYGLDMYYKRGYIASVDHELRNVDLMFEDDVIYRGFSVQGLLNALENQFGKRNFADGGDLKGVKLDFELETDGDYDDMYEDEVEKIKLLREVVDFDEVVGNIDTGKTIGNTNLKFYENDIVVMTLKGDYDTDTETLDADIDVLGYKYKINYHPMNSMGGFDSSKLKKELEKIDYKKSMGKRGWLSYVKDNSSYFDIEDESEEFVLLTTRENGNVGDEEYGIEDIEEAKSIVKKIKEKYPKTKVSIYTVDEFVYLELEAPKNFADGGGVNVGYNVFNYTDNIYATDEVFKTKALANKFIKEFRSRFSNQGYYRDNRMNKINIQDIDLLAIPSDFNPFKKFADGGEIEVVYERRADFKKKPIKLLLLSRGKEQKGYTFSGKDQVAVLENYNRNKQEDLEKLWNLKGYESKYADGGDIEKIKEGDKVVYKDNFYLVSKIVTRNVQGLHDVQYHLHSYKRNLQDVVVDNVKFIKKFADGGELDDFSDNQLMIMNQNVEVEHHHEELEDILEDKIPVPAWVVAKMETATQNLSDITHYLDGEKELMEDQLEEEDDDYDDDEMETEDIENKEVVEPIVVTAGDKTEITKNFTNDAFGNLKGFLKGMEGIDLRDDYTFDYKDEQYEVEPIINSDENGVSNAVFTIFDGDGEEVGEVAYSRDGGKQKFTANSEFFSWNNAKFEDGGYFDGAIPKTSSYMSNYAKGGEIAKAEILGLSKNIMGTTDIEMKISGMRKSQDFIVYPISADDTDKIITIQSSTRIGKIDLSTGRGLMSQSHSNGAYFVHFQMDKLTPFTISESDLEDLKMHIFKTAGDNVGSRGIVSDNSGASRIFAKGGGLEKVKWQEVEIGDSARVKELNRLGLVMHTYGRKFNLKFPNGTEKTFDASELEFFKLEKDEYEMDDNNNFAKGGMVVTSVKDIPNFKERLEQRRITYRGLGMGKVADDFYKLAGTSGTRIKVDGKEYFITDEEFDTFSRDADGKMQIRFDAPARKGYADGGFMNGVYEDGGFLDKYEVDRFKQVMNGKAIAKYIVRLQDSFGNKETYVFGIKIKDQFKGCELVPYESLYGGWSNSGTAFSLDNLQVEKLVPNKFFNIELDEQETEMLVNKLVKNNQAGVEKYLNSVFFYLSYNQSFKDVLRGHLARSVVKIVSVEFEIAQKFADGGFMNDVYADGGQVRVGDRYKYNWSDGRGNNGYSVVEIVKQSVTSSKDYKTKVMVVKVVESSDPSQVGRLEEEYKPSFKKAVRLGMYKPLQERKRKLVDEDYANGGSVKKDWWQTVVNPNEDFHNYDNRKPIDWEVDDFKEWVVSNSDLDGNVDKEVLDVVKMPKSKLTVEYLNKNGSGKNNNEYYKEFGNWQSALYDIFTQLKKDYLFKKERKYILKSDIKTVTVKRKGKEVTYNGSDVLNGAYVLAKGGDITSKANYVGKNDVVEVELKDGSKVKPVNGYWIKKGAEPISNEPMPTTSAKSGSKVGETYIRKDMRNNWKAETNVDDFNGYDWRISTIKTYSGNLVSSAQGGKTESTGTKGIVMFKYTMYEDPNYTLEVSTPKRLTEKLVTEQQEKALAKFKKFMETGNFGKGGKISNFDKLSAKVAKQYEGKPVKSQYQEEYGKYYSKEEAQEVGDKVAGKVKAMQPAKKEMGGGTKKATSGSEMLKQANILAKEIRKDGESWNDAKKRAFAQLKK